MGRGLAALSASVGLTMLAGCGDPAPAQAATAALAAPATTPTPPAGPALALAALAPAPQFSSPTLVDLAPDLPLYPGAVLEGGTASLIALPQGTTLMLTLHSADPAWQVAHFYRDALRARAAGREFADLGSAGPDGGALLVLADTAAGHALQVQVSPAGDGSAVQIVSTHAAR